MTEVMPAEQAAAARSCASCPKMCRSACPTQAVTANERHQPWGHARQVVEALRDGGFADPELVDGVYACATCSACTPPCHVDGVETPELVWAARAAVHAAGATPSAGLEAVFSASDGLVPDGWTDPQPVLDALRTMATPGAELLLFPGCGALGRRSEAVLAAGRVLRALGVPFDVASEHRCCGMPGLTFGDHGSMDAMLSGVAEQVGATRARRVAVQSPSCAYFLGVRSREHLGDVEVEPLAATLARALAESSAQPPAQQGSVAYHDPCYLARHQRRREEPRAALRAAGYDVQELPGHGDTTQCSGQGGGLPLTHPDIAAGYLRLLQRQVEQAQAPQVVTGCASCAAALRQVGTDASELSEAIAEALGVEEGG